MRQVDEPLIPEAFWLRLKSFVEASGTGRFVLHIKEGNVLACEVTESMRRPIDKDDKSVVK